jgi:rRNA-processing protein FCF1
VIKAVLDSNAVDDLLGGRFDVWAEAIRNGELDLLWTHVTTDELAEVKDADRRAQLIAVGAALCRMVPTGAFVLDYSRLGMARLSEDGEAIEEFRRGRIKHTRDALICATAEYERCTVISNDGDMKKRARDRGLTVWTPAEVDQHLNGTTLP